MKTTLALLLLLLLPTLLPAQRIQGDFEHWDTTSFTRPWTDVDTPYVGVLPAGWSAASYYGVGRSSDAHTGSWSASIWNWYGEIAGVMVLGQRQVNDDGRGLIYGGVPVDEVPARLVGSYKFLPGETYSADDSAMVVIILKRFDAGQSKADTLSLVRASLGPAPNWTPFEIAIPAPRDGARPDSVAVGFFSSRAGICKEARCCNLLMDDLSFASAAGVPLRIEQGRLAGAVVSPNPLRSSSVISFDGAADGHYRVSLVDAAGREVRALEAVGSRVELERGDLADGAYLFLIRDAAGIPVASGRIVVGEQ